MISTGKLHLELGVQQGVRLKRVPRIRGDKGLTQCRAAAAPLSARYGHRRVRPFRGRVGRRP